MNGKQDAALIQTSFVTLGFVLRNAQTNQRTGDTTDSGTDSHPCQRGHNRARCDERTDSRNRESAYACEKADCAANYHPEPPPAAAPSGAFVDFAVPIGREPRLSGSSAEMSEDGKPLFTRTSVGLFAASSVE